MVGPGRVRDSGFALEDDLWRTQREDSPGRVFGTLVSAASSTRRLGVRFFFARCGTML